MSTGFLYAVSRTGVTGERQELAGDLREFLRTLRSFTKLPIAVGFGISNPEQARLVAQHADAVVVGSAVVNQIAQHGKSAELVRRVSGFVSSLGDAVKAIQQPRMHTD